MDNFLSSECRSSASHPDRDFATTFAKSRRIHGPSRLVTRVRPRPRFGSNTPNRIHTQRRSGNQGNSQNDENRNDIETHRLSSLHDGPFPCRSDSIRGGGTGKPLQCSNFNCQLSVKVRASRGFIFPYKEEMNRAK